MGIREKRYKIRKREKVKGKSNQGKERGSNEGKGQGGAKFSVAHVHPVGLAVGYKKWARRS